MTLFKIIILGIVEGITEWLPISSTGHMLLLDSVFPLPLRAEFKEVFFVVIQLGAILAVLVIFWKKLLPFRLKKEEKISVIADMGALNLWSKVIIATLPAAIIGFLIDDFLEAHLHTPLVIALMLILYGAAFIVIETSKTPRQSTSTASDISYMQAWLIGVFQTLALIPGTSRSGATILGALLVGVSRSSGAEFSFLLAIPVTLGASALKLFKLIANGGGFLGAELGYLLLGASVAFFLSLWAIHFLTSFVKKHDFKVFGWYRIALGALVIAYLVIPNLL